MVIPVELSPESIVAVTELLGKRCTERRAITRDSTLRLDGGAIVPEK